ncbi:hypothetical protein H0H93_008634 [Arthromyces matolae]|nr:hypothetical protein H0H93_008634 [Arthromyces matolae]
MDFIAPSMFGRDLVEQVRADARGEDLRVPVIVDKCIQAVETIGIVTSVLKKYFRSLPAPLLTYDLHDEFMATVQLKGQTSRDATMLDLVNRLPNEHYYTLRMLMLHLHRIHELSDINKMNARNLGVVFGPTLMRSPDPAQEFNDMAGKALTIEWLVENAPRIFNAQGGHGSTSYHQ